MIITSNKSLIRCDTIDDLKLLLSGDKFKSYLKDVKSFDNIEHRLNDLLTNTDRITTTLLGQTVRSMFSYNKKYGSWREVCYWTIRGYTEDEARDIISNKQRQVMSKVIEKYLANGYTEEEAWGIIREEKSNHNKIIFSSYSDNQKRKMSARCVEFWIEKGYDLESARVKVSETQVLSTLDKFIERYGEVDGIKRYQETCKKVARYGESNGMYGRPAPQGSGNGWSGWYRGIFFRSIIELSYIIYLDSNNIEFKVAETKDYSVKYDIDGSIKNYFPDFHLIDTDEIVEIKPYNLINTRLNILKFEAARLIYGERFKVVTEKDIPILTTHDMVEMYNTNQIVFTDRYKQKFIERYLNEG